MNNPRKATITIEVSYYPERQERNLPARVIYIGVPGKPRHRFRGDEIIGRALARDLAEAATQGESTETEP